MFVTSRVSRSRNCQYLSFYILLLSNLPYSDAENRVAALERMFSVYQNDRPELVEHMEAAADAFKQLSEANGRLEKYKRTYGDLSTLPPDVSFLAKQLCTKEEELERLRMSAMQQTEVFHAQPYLSLINLRTTV